MGPAPAYALTHGSHACISAWVWLTNRCVHEAGLVWTDLKLDNMLLCQGGEVKAIDLESAVPAKSAPKSFSPEAMPPDFAIASVGGVSAHLNSMHIAHALLI